MKITKFVHSCLLVEMPAPINRTALFDPGEMSTVDVDRLEYLDDIFITHIHGDHYDPERIKRLVAKFPNVRVTATAEIVADLAKHGITAHGDAPGGVTFFESPHEKIRPYFDSEPPQEIGVHYLDLLSHPGDSHSFTETKAVLALPVQAPWGSARAAAELAIKLKPKYVIPIHDWHWHDAARIGAYDKFEAALAKEGITFIKAINGEPFVLDV
jgi:L-ascorbate metabolism protein UlaG (beta-lactamase superfamily)